MGRTIQVLLLVLILSMFCYFSGLSYFIVCKGPEQEGSLGLLSSLPLPETSQFAGTCAGTGIDIISMIGDSFEYVFLGWAVVGAIWILVILRDVTDSLRHWVANGES